MKFIINSILFSKQIQSVSGVITNNNAVPIINCFHFHLDEHQLTIRTTDLETTLIVKVNVDATSTDGITDIAVPSKLLLDIVKSLDDVPLTFSAEEDNYGITIVSGEGKYHLSGMNPETFPSTPEAKETSTITLSGHTLSTAIGKTSFAVSSEETRPQMAGILCDMNEENITFVATDAHKLVRYRCHGITCDKAVSFILSRKPVMTMRNILVARKEDCEVKMEFNNTNVFFSFDNYYVACRLVDGKYPNYDAAIPKENPNHLTIDRNSFLNTLRRVDLFASQASHQVRLAMHEHEIVVSAEDLEFSNEANEKLACEYEGEPMEIGFSAKFLIEMVQNLDTDQILIEMSHPSRAGILLPIYTEENHNTDELLMLVMPIMLAN